MSDDLGSRTTSSKVPCAYDREGYDLERALASVERGWRPLVLLAWLLVPPGIRVVQVKPKLGRLRIYLESEGDGIALPPEWPRDALVAVSEQTCELCGDRGSVRDDWWVLCEGHWTEGHRAQGRPRRAGIADA